MRRNRNNVCARNLRSVIVEFVEEQLVARADVEHALGIQASEERVEQVLREAELREHQPSPAPAPVVDGWKRLRAVFGMQLSIHSRQPSVCSYLSACKQYAQESSLMSGENQSNKRQHREQEACNYCTKSV